MSAPRHTSRRDRPGAQTPERPLTPDTECTMSDAKRTYSCAPTQNRLSHSTTSARLSPFCLVLVANLVMAAAAVTVAALAHRGGGVMRRRWHDSRGSNAVAERRRRRFDRPARTFHWRTAGEAGRRELERCHHDQRRS